MDVLLLAFWLALLSFVPVRSQIDGGKVIIIIIIIIIAIASHGAKVQRLGGIEWLGRCGS